MRSAKVIGSGSGKLIAPGSAKLTTVAQADRRLSATWLIAQVFASGSAKVIGSGSAKVIGRGSAKVTAGGDGQSDREPRHPSCQEDAEMSAKRIETHVLQDLVRLHRKGNGARAVARLMGISPNTERCYRLAFEKAGLLSGSADELPTLEQLRAAVQEHAPAKRPPQQLSSVERWLPTIEEMTC